MEEKKNPIIAKIGLGIIKGLPILKTLKELIKPSIVTGPMIGNEKVQVSVQRPRPDWKEVVTEVITVALILAFVFGKITIQDLQTIISLVK